MRYVRTAGLLLTIGNFLAVPAAVNISGTVTDSATHAPVQGAIVSLAGGGATGISDQAGHYTLGSAASSRASLMRPARRVMAEAVGTKIRFTVSTPSPVRIEAISLSGRRVGGSLLDHTLASGAYELDVAQQPAAPQLMLFRVRIGGEETVVGSPLLICQSGPKTALRPGGCAGLPKRTAAIDTLIAWSVGYDIAKNGIESLSGTRDISLRRTVQAGSVQMIQTSQAGDRLVVKAPQLFAADDGSTMPTVTVDTGTLCQSMVGFGAAFTETSVWNLTQMGAEKTKEILNAYFNPYTGSGYTFTRTHINSCDFCIANYCYDTVAGDYTLDHFDISHELKWMIPRIKEAAAVPGSDFILFGSPWAPPAWMKTTNQMLHGGELKPACYAAWALYFVKYIQEMEKNGVPIWGVTIQNEPEYSPDFWEGCRYTPEQERDFLKNYLGPAFKQHNRDEKIMVFDHNKDHVAVWASTIMGDTAAAKYAWGTAYHWYTGDQFDNLAAAHTAAPAKQLIGTECSLYDSDFRQYSGGERMAHGMIGDINNWSAGYQTWNLVCDVTNLGPSDAGTKCPSPIMVNVSTKSVEYEPDYYYMTHFSRYVRPGAVRLKSSSDNANIETVSFKNTNGSIVTLVLNRTANAISFKLKLGSRIVKPTVSAHALIDFIYF
jgi:glucosylceramidase